MLNAFKNLGKKKDSVDIAPAATNAAAAPAPAQSAKRIQDVIKQVYGVDALTRVF
jgi:hypothetical protein